MVRHVALGGIVGALVRWVVLVDAGFSSFPIRTLVINLIGTALLVALVPRMTDPHWRTGLAVGFCGGVTSVSTLAFELSELVRREMFAEALFYGTASAFGGVIVIESIRRAGLMR
ncbi:MAG: CrcB family protein [Acidobacteria bacterium]|nr:CrcB family protein [Acidobacteriota bacterium]